MTARVDDLEVQACAAGAADWAFRKDVTARELAADLYDTRRALREALVVISANRAPQVPVETLRTIERTLRDVLPRDPTIPPDMHCEWCGVHTSRGLCDECRGENEAKR